MAKQAKKPARVNPKSVERIKMLLDREKLKQYQLAESIASAPETISAIMNLRKPLTSSMAYRIIEVFPEYRYEWLMGEGDDRTITKEDLKVLWYQGLIADFENVEQAVKLLSESCGYTFGIPMEYQTDSDGNIAIDDEKEITIRLDGNRIATCSRRAFDHLQEEIREYMLFKLQQLCKGKESNHAEQ